MKKNIIAIGILLIYVFVTYIASRHLFEGEFTLVNFSISLVIMGAIPVLLISLFYFIRDLLGK